MDASRFLIRFTGLLCAAALLLTLAACGGQSAAAPADASSEPAASVSAAAESSSPQAEASSAAAEPIGHFDGPVLVASAGLGADASMIDVVMNKAGISHVLELTPSDSQITAAKTMIVVAGASSKGLGAAGISAAQEQARVKKMLKTAVDNGVQIVCAHVGGESRRGEISDPFIRMVLNDSSYIVVVQSGNADGLFTDFAASNNLGMDEVANVAGTAAVFEKLFA